MNSRRLIGHPRADNLNPNAQLIAMGAWRRGQDVGNERSAESKDLLTGFVLRSSQWRAASVRNVLAGA